MASMNDITELDIAIIRRRIEDGDKNSDIAATYGLNQGRITEIKQGKYHPHVKPANDAMLNEWRRNHVSPEERLQEELKVALLEVSNLKQKLHRAERALDNMVRHVVQDWGCYAMTEIESEEGNDTSTIQASPL